MRSQPIRTLNAVPPTAAVLLDLSEPLLHEDDNKLLCDDWATLFEICRRQGVTHYLTQDQADVYPYDRMMPIIEAHDPALAAELRARRIIFERNKSARDAYLQAHATLTPLTVGMLNNFKLYTLDPAVIVQPPVRGN